MKLLKIYTEAEITAMVSFHENHCRVGSGKRIKDLFVQIAFASLSHETIRQQLITETSFPDDLMLMHDLLCAVEQEEVRQFGKSE